MDHQGAAHVSDTTDEQDRRFASIRQRLAASRDRDATLMVIGELRALAEEGHAEANVWLGNCYQFSMAVAADFEEAGRLYEIGRAAGSAAGAYRLGDLHAGALIPDADPVRARALFREAAQRGNHAGACQLAYLLTRGIGGEPAPAEATEVLERTAQDGSPRAMLALAERYARGDTVGADPGAAMHWAGRAAERNYPLAEEFYHQLAAAGHQLSPEVAPVSPDDAAHAPLVPTLETYNEAPRIQGVRDLLGVADRAHMIAMAAPLIRPSRVVRPMATGPGAEARHPARSSGDMGFHRGFADITIRSYVQDAARVAGREASHGEPLVILKYGAGDEYTPHFDFFDGDFSQELANGGQRTTTVLCYLNHVARGGSTEFPVLGVDVPPLPGTGVIFDNVDADGVPDKRSLHAGRPVIEGWKWMATLWFRQDEVPYGSAA